MNVEELLPIFIEECNELLDQMETNLLAAERGEDDPDTINAIFRAAHTIKGSAGIYGLDSVVRFAHAMENVLDDVRSSRRPLDSELIALLLKSCDYAGTLVEQVAAGVDDDEATKNQGELLEAQLRGMRPPAQQAKEMPPDQNSAVIIGTTKPALDGGPSELVAADHCQD